MSTDRPSARGIIRRVTGEVTGRVVAAVDPDVVLAEVDVEALVERIDPEALLERIDPDRLLDRIDPNRLLDRVDPNRLLDRVDVDRLLDHVDADRLLDQVDPDRLLDRVDVDRFLDRVDPNRLLARVDVDALLAGVDLEALVRRSGVPEIVAESTNALGLRTLDLARRQLVSLDVLIDQVTDRLLRRDFSTEPAGPARLVQAGERRGDVQPGRRRSVTGHYAGPVTRLASIAADAAIVVSSFTVGVAGIDFLARVFLGLQADRAGFSPLAVAALVAWAFVYTFGGLAVAGRTVGKALVGNRVVTRDGRTISVRRAFLRTLAFPLSAVLGLGFLLALFHREHGTLHDLVAGTTVVYDWGERPVELSGPLTAYLDRQS
ncbi:RDD family protein [Nocardioides perillae]|uniref:Putative RDD family membrane protein YckC n=1 Tax=Nocardioides perillae TaxID=1119534 RepID=A0A7Y9UJQ6_9ACTN|nr:putative RDD family membrane protein YckC [Nocardioides perillae]